MIVRIQRPRNARLVPRGLLLSQVIGYQATIREGEHRRGGGNVFKLSPGTKISRRLGAWTTQLADASAVVEAFVWTGAEFSFLKASVRERVEFLSGGPDRSADRMRAQS